MRRHCFTLTLLAVIVSCVSYVAQAASNIIEDNFTGASATLDWDAIGTMGGTPGAWTPCLTAGNNTGSIPACTDMATPDTVGNGALRLTDNNDDEVGDIMSNFTFPSNEGIQVTFTTYTYGGDGGVNPDGVASGADGMAFYLFNGDEPPDDLGGIGGALGYSCKNWHIPADGMAGAYLGLGIDEFGNWLNPGDNTNTGIDGYPHPGEIGLRGYGNVNLAALQSVNPNATEADVENTCRDGGTYTYTDANGETQTATFPDYAMIPGAYKILPTNEPIFSQENDPTATRTKATPITYKLIISPTGLLSFWYNYNNTGLTQVLNQQSISASNGPMPSSFRFGFGASTGGATNIHEITCFAASPANRAVGAPVAPLSVSSGDLVYTLNSDLDPVAGHAEAYTVSANGTPSSSPLWDAGSLMTSSQRQSDLYSSASDGVTTTSFASLDPPAFALTATTCVPNVQTIIDYTIDPNSITAPSGCPSYLGPRESGWLLGEISSGDAGHLLTPPADPMDLALPGYIAYAQSESARPPALLFTDNDGFLYSVNAQTGAMNWGFIPRPLVAQLQNYEVVPTDSPGLMDGEFTPVDAVNPAGTWATYLVGTDDGGAGWYDLALSATGGPAVSVALPALPSGAVYPQRQAPVVANVPMTVGSGSSASTQVQQIAAYVANTGSGSSATSTLYEFNVATGASTSYAISIGSNKAIAAQVSSILYLDPASNAIYFGDAGGNVYEMPVTGNAQTDESNITLLGTTQDGLPVLFVGYEDLNGEPYLWAASQSGLTVFGIGAAGWQPLWASSGTTGYTYAAQTSSWSTATTIPALLPAGQSAGAVQISAAPTLVDGILIVPTYLVPSTSANTCGIAGNGYYDFFDIVSGAFPLDAIKTSGGQYLTGDQYVGVGAPFTPTVSISPTGLPVLGGTTQTVTPVQPIEFSKHAIDTIVQWREQ
ncbi:MAG: hypothetical protein ACYDHY_15455 [Acidiferrobacterales bacterium]